MFNFMAVAAITLSVVTGPQDVRTETFPLRNLDPNQAVKLVQVDGGIEAITLDYKMNQLLVRGSAEALAKYKMELNDKDKPSVTYRVDIKTIECKVSKSGEISERVVNSPMVMTTDNSRAMISFSSTESSDNYYITPGTLNGKSVNLEVEFRHLDDEKQITQSVEGKFQMTLGEKRRIMGYTTHQDAMLRKQVRKGDIITNKGPYTGIYFEVTVTEAGARK